MKTAYWILLLRHGGQRRATRVIGALSDAAVRADATGTATVFTLDNTGQMTGSVTATEYFNDDNSGDCPRSGVALRDPGGAPNHGGVPPRVEPAPDAICPCASHLDANRLDDCANDRHANIGRHGPVKTQPDDQPYWRASAKGSRRPGLAPRRRRLQLRYQGLTASSAWLMQSPLLQTR